jgi:four helix bundle protein
MVGPPARKGDNIAHRLLVLGATSVAVARSLPRDGAGRHIAMQLIRSGTSGGANYEEARAAESDADFVHKLGIAAKEVREAMYWLKLVRMLRMYDGPLDEVLREADSLVAILLASIRTVRSKPNAPETPL